MPHCFSFNPASPEASSGDDPLPNPSLAGGGAASTFNLSRELAHAFQTPSHHDRRSRLLAIDPTPENLELFLSQELQPNKECVQEALRHAKQTTLTKLVSTYFQHSEDATRFCLNLYQNVHSARCHLYTPLLQLFHVLPADAAIDQSLCNLAFDVFRKLDTFENPFSSPESHSSQDTKLCLSQLKHNVDRRLCKSKSRLRLLHHATAGSALCLVTAVVAVAASAAVIAYHALPTLVVVVAGPLCTPYLPHSFKKKELTNISQLNVASKGTFVLNKDLDTIDSLVYRLHTAIKNDKLLIRLGLERGRDVFLIQGFLKQLHKSHNNHTHQLEVLVDHICSWFTYVNDSRSSLLKELYLPPRTHGNL